MAAVIVSKPERRLLSNVLESPRNMKNKLPMKILCSFSWLASDSSTAGALSFFRYRLAISMGCLFGIFLSPHNSLIKRSSTFNYY